MEYDETGFVEAEDGTRLFYGVRGEGPDVVLNDGIGCDGFAWKYLHPHLAAHYRVIHWHYRGHGRSGPPLDPARLDIVTLSRDLKAVLDHVGTDEAVLIGHSMGTQVCLEAYRLMTERVVGLVLMCGSHGRVTKTFHGKDTLHRVLPGVIEKVQQYLGLARGIWGRITPTVAYRIGRLSGEIDAAGFSEEDFRAYWLHIAHMDPDVFLPMLRLAGEHSAEDLLPKIDVPTLVIAAERDTFTPPEIAAQMAALIPGARHVLLAGGSHAAPVEHPDKIEREIDDFLSRLEHDAG